MALPDLITLDPPTGLVRTELSIPGSKSLTNRALILAALAHGEVTLRGALWSEDTQVMVTCLSQLGFDIDLSPDPHEPANRTLRVQGLGGQIPNGGTSSNPLELFVGNAGTAARFLTALVCLGQGVYRLHGISRMHERPQSRLITALRQLGYRVETATDRLPLIIHGTGPRNGVCEVPLAGSSQFASALLLSATVGGWQVEIVGTEEEEEAPYVQMTQALIQQFPYSGGEVFIEPDASSGSYFLAANWLLQHAGKQHALAAVESSIESSHVVLPGNRGEDRPSSSEDSWVHVRHWPTSGWQVDAQFPKFLPLPREISRQRHLGDSILTAMILAPFGSEPVQFTDLARLRVQECERVQAMRVELSKCGVRVVERGDSLEIWPGPVHGAEIETYNDHRIAMCFAILSLQVEGIKIRNPACVKKTFPNFFSKLAEPQPRGLGVTVRGLPSGQILSADQWNAE